MIYGKTVKVKDTKYIIWAVYIFIQYMTAVVEKSNTGKYAGEFQCVTGFKKRAA